MAWWDQTYAHAYAWVDLLLITPYRVFGNPVAGFYFGTFVLCALCVILGEITFRVASGVNHSHIRGLSDAMTRMHNLSVKALVLRDKENYQACNALANEAFGKYFFNMITLGAAALWPVPFALAWMHTRFGGIELELMFSLPLLGNSVAFPAVMIPMYILCRVIWAGLKRRFPVLAGSVPAGGHAGERMISMREVDEHGGLPEKYWQND